MKSYENFSHNWAHLEKKLHYLQNYDLFKITFCVITCIGIKLQA